MRSWRPRNSAIFCWTAITISATSGLTVAVGFSDELSILSRASGQCGGNSSLTYCGNGLPGYFCCSGQTTCKQLSNTATPASICCPNGSDCFSLAIISCNTTVQANPQAPAHMLDLTVALPTCGPECCPLGYQCVNDQGQFSCLIKESTKPATTSQPTDSASAISASPSASQSSALAAASTSSSIPGPGIASGQSSNKPNPPPNKFPAAAILVGLLPGIAIGALLVLAIIFIKRRRDQHRRSTRGNELFGGPTPPTSSRGLQISSPINRPEMSSRTDFIHKRSASENTILQPTSPMRNVIQASQNLRRTLSSGGTLVQSSQREKTPTISLGPIFETPTRPQRTEQKNPRALFSSRSSVRSRELGPNPTRLTLSRSGASQETIDVLMRPAPTEFDFGQPLKMNTEYDDISPVTPETTYSDVYRAAGVASTTYSDVYRAAGVSPTKAEARARQLMERF